MTLPVSGTISISQISVELGRSSTATTSLGETASRNLAGVATGAISMSDFYGKSAAFSFTISANTTNANLRTLAVSAGWNQSSAVTATIAAGVYVYSTSIATPALTINGSWPGGITLINNGYIMGMGGNGGDKTVVYSSGDNPQAGGIAISLGVNVTITNNSYIGGGGGGGYSYFSYGSYADASSGGGGAGGGRGGRNLTFAAPWQGGAGGGVGASGANGTVQTTLAAGGGGGGRIFPGTGGAARTQPNTISANYGNGGGSGGGGASTIHLQQYTTNRYHAGAGGGGGWGAAGGRLRYQSRSIISFTTAAGGSAGNTGGEATSLTGVIGTGGAGGKCVALNGYTVTWSVTGTRYGAIS